MFDQGPLAVAQRASMSIPAAFSPVVVNDRVLVDGYVANNLPIDVAQELGAEAIIAVDISTPVWKLDDLRTALGIQGQVGTFPVQQQQAAQIERLKPGDVLLQPDLGDIAAASFTQMEEAIAIGTRGRARQEGRAVALLGVGGRVRSMARDAAPAAGAAARDRRDSRSRTNRCSPTA